MPRFSEQHRDQAPGAGRIVLTPEGREVQFRAAVRAIPLYLPPGFQSCNNSPSTQPRCTPSTCVSSSRTARVFDGTPPVLSVPVGWVVRADFRGVTHALTPMPTSINEVLGTDVFQRLCVTSGVW
jgi:hypothetical protein